MSGRIIFRGLTLLDVKDLFEIYSDKEAMKYRGSGPMLSFQDAEDFVRTARKRENQILTIRKGVELRETKKLIGSVIWRFRDDREKECEIGYSIGRKYWGKGLGRIVVEELVKSVTEKEEIDQIIAWCNKENIASFKILEKLGFQQISQNEHTDRYLYVRSSI